MAKNKSYNKLIAGTMTAAMVAGVVAPVAASAEEKKFSDVPAGHWSEKAINDMAEKGIIKGNGNGTFGFGDNVTRAQVATFMVKAKEVKIDENAKPSFTDVAEDNIYKKFIAAAEANRIMSGLGNGVFGPDNELTRAQMAQILVNAYGFSAEGKEKATFNDIDGLGWDTAKSSIETLASLGVVSGKGTGFDPNGTVTREEAAQFIYNAMNYRTVESVKVEDGNTVTVKMEKPETGLDAKNFTVVVDGKKVKPSKIVADENGSTYKFTVDSLEGKAGKVVVNGEATEYNLTVAKIESVNAINAKQVQVKFSQPVDSLTALNKDNYKIQTNADSKAVPLSSRDANAKLTLSEDKKTVTITTTSAVNTAFGKGTAIVAGTPFKFTVDGVKAKDGKEIAKETFTISSKDELAPSALTASAKAKTTTTKVTVEFSEPVDINGAIAYVGGEAATVAAGPTPTTVTLTTAQALTAGKEYDLTLLNFKDFAGNFLDKNPTNTKFTVTADAVAPVVEDVKVVRDNLIEVTFDKAMDAATFAGNTRILDANGVAQGGAINATIKSNTGGKTVRVATTTAVPFNDNGTFAGTLVLGDGIKDASGNAKAATSHAVTLTKDTVKPTVSSASYVAAGAQYAGNTYTNGAIVVKMSEEVDLGTADYKLISSAGVVSAVTVTPGLNPNDAKEVILSLNNTLSVDTYTLRVGNDAVKDLSTQQNTNVAAVTTVKVDGSSDTDKPVVDTANNVVVKAATNQTTGTTIEVNMKDNVGLDLATVQNVTNYLLDGKPLPAGSYVTVAHNTGSSNTAAKDVTATLNIPAKSIAKDADYALNINNIKDKAGNTATPKVANAVKLQDDISPELKEAKISSNGLLAMSFTEAVNTAVGAEADFQFVINGTEVAVENTATIVKFADGTGTDKGKYVVTFNALVDAGLDKDPAKTADNRLFLDVDGSTNFTAADILIQTGTTKAVGATTLDLNALSTLKVKVAADNIVKDASTLKNPIKKDTTITVK